MIAGGVKQCIQQEEKKFKLDRKANVDFLEKCEEKKVRPNWELKARNRKLLNLIKTKNSLLQVKSEIEDIKTKVNNKIRESIQPKACGEVFESGLGLMQLGS